MGEVSRSVRRYLSDILGEEEFDKYLLHIAEEPALYLRVNRLKSSKETLQKKLISKYDIKTENIPGIPYGIKVLTNTQLAGKTVEHIMGEYYIQGLSSMIPPIVLAPLPTDKVLDLAAAPGSKTTEIGEMMGSKGMLVANEISLDRVKMLVSNLDRMNLVNYGVLHFKGELLSKIYPDYFDKILVDAPCSGLGIIQKKGEVNDWWSKKKAVGLGELQTKLLVAAVKMLKPGGELVYSTCTLTVEENELVLDKLLRKYPLEMVPFNLPLKNHGAIINYEGNKLDSTLQNAKRLIPWEVNSDGFFIAKLRKTGETHAPARMEIKKPDLKFLRYDSKLLKGQLANIPEEFGIPDEELLKYKFIKKGNDIFFVSEEWDEKHSGIFERIGTKFGVIDKTGKITLHTQAAQVFGRFIIKGICDLNNTSELKTYLEGGIIKRENLREGQCVIRYEGNIVGTAIITAAGIKSRFPRAKRTQEIIYQ